MMAKPAMNLLAISPCFLSLRQRAHVKALREHASLQCHEAKARLFSNRWAAANDVCVGCSGDLPPPSPPAEKATASKDQAGKAREPVKPPPKPVVGMKVGETQIVYM
jgi:hypothetical protein